LQKTADAYKLWHDFVKNFPRLSRYTLGYKIDTLFTGVIEYILLAGYASREQKLPIIQKISAKLDSLKFFLKLAWEMKLLNDKKYAALFQPIVEVGKMLGRWQQQLLNKTPPS